MVALPIGLGILLGRFLDDRLGTGPFWTLVLLSGGIGVAAIELALAARAALRGDDDA